jgi:Ribbon-helix-helix protein, copG family
MRTTVRLPDNLMRQIKRLAVETDRTLTQVIEDSLREALARARGAGSTEEPFRVRTFRGTGLAPGLSLDHMADLLDVMDSEDHAFH